MLRSNLYRQTHRLSSRVAIRHFSFALEWWKQAISWGGWIKKQSIDFENARNEPYPYKFSTQILLWLEWKMKCERFLGGKCWRFLFFWTKFFRCRNLCYFTHYSLTVAYATLISQKQNWSFLSSTSVQTS